MPGGQVTLDYDTFALLNELFARQRAHMDAIGAYVDDHCHLASSFGLLLGWLKPQYEAGQAIATTGFTQGALIASSCAELIGSTRDAYAAADRHEFTTFDRLLQELALTELTYEAPSSDAHLGTAHAGYEAEPAPNHSIWATLKDGQDDARRTADVAAEFAWRQPSKTWGTAAPTDPLDLLTPKAYLSHAVSQGTDHAIYAAMDHHNGLAPGTSSAQLRIQQDLRYGDGFLAGHVDASIMTSSLGLTQSNGPHTAWLTEHQTKTISTAVDTPFLVADTISSVTSVVVDTCALAESAQTLSHLTAESARPANTGSYLWATGQDGR